MQYFQQLCDDSPKEKLLKEQLFKSIKRSMDEMADNKEPINHAIELTKKGYLGRGQFGLAYKGSLIGHTKQYAVKMTYPMYEADARKEYEMYTYLKAIDNSDVEQYGIPAIYYYGVWRGLAVMAMTLFDSEFGKSMEEKKFEELDVLIMFREFVSKYMPLPNNNLLRCAIEKKYVFRFSFS